MPKLAYRPKNVPSEQYLLLNESVQEHCKCLKNKYGDQMCINDLKNYMNCHRDTAVKLLTGLRFVKAYPDGRKKWYKTLEVARMLAERECS